MKENALESFLKQFADSPARLAWVEAYLSDPEPARELLSAIDESPYGLPQWVDAFIVMGEWLDAHGKSSAFQEQLGYLHCACEAAGAGANFTTLSTVLSEMLETYGFDQAQPK